MPLVELPGPPTLGVSELEHNLTTKWPLDPLGWMLHWAALQGIA
jgi:hypothetical protein